MSTGITDRPRPAAGHRPLGDGDRRGFRRRPARPGARHSENSRGRAQLRRRSNEGRRLLAGLVRLLVLRWRTGWVGLVAWPAAITAISAVVAYNLGSLYDTEAKRLTYEQTLARSTATAAMNGRGYDLSTLGGIVVYEIGFMGLLLFPLMGIHLAIRHTRAEEQAGRVELLTAARVGRFAPLTVAVIVTMTSIVVAGIGLFAALVGFDLDAGPSLRYAAGMTLLIASYGAVAFLAAQVSQSTRGAWGLSLGALAVTFMVRAVADGRTWTRTWLSPSGWLAELRPFGSDPEVWPYWAYAALTAVLLALAYLVASWRELDAGLIRERPGPARAIEPLRRPVGLLVRLTAGTTLAWAGGAAAWGACLGLLSKEMRTLLDSNQELRDIFGKPGQSADDLMVSLALLLAALLASAAGLQLIGRLTDDERAGRTGLLLSSRVSRAQWWLAGLAVTAVEVSLVLFAGALATAVGVDLADLPAQYERIVKAASWYLAPVLLVVAAGALLSARWLRARPAAWLVVLWGFAVAVLAEALKLKQWMKDLSPFYRVGFVPGEAAHRDPVWVMAALAAALALGSVLVFRRRNLERG